MTPRLVVSAVVHAPIWKAELGRIASRHPGLKIIIDRMGIMARRVDDEHPNIYVKVSALPGGPRRAQGVLLHAGPGLLQGSMAVHGALTSSRKEWRSRPWAETHARRRARASVSWAPALPSAGATVDTTAPLRHPALDLYLKENRPTSRCRSSASEASSEAAC
ncbi:hypothetical protein KZ829_17050 [Actinoplanes hulinensis]|uniref:Uncharacterized protein n=1 Tax=Actinoplanes hulinensis TaxID=1144547 RepID=A0ABS7B343_9ACTN|nr:hypothetical protein [Actinoplanes hulinensis]MBW6435448.1 hypothetical protein [Actinoplanes hulinensis]